jgi:glycosyltransferase involved in cell wall biosynthesis
MIDTTPRLDLSIIVPLYNEEESVHPLYEAITQAIQTVCSNYEILLVDDGSADNTFTKARDLARQDPRLRVLRLRKNFGQTPAMVAGIDVARGKTLITMDGDLQNDPADIGKFLHKMSEGYDIVVGWRHDRKDKVITRKIPSRIANWLIGKVTGVPIKDNGCSLKAYRADIIKNVPLYSELHRFIPAMVSLTGARIAEIKVRHHPRRYGVSKYGLSRIYRVLLDLLTVKTLISFAARPLLWFSILALPLALVSCLAIVFSIYKVLIEFSSFSIPIAGTGVLFGALVVILLLGGVLAELVYKTGDTRLDTLASLTTREVRVDTEPNNTPLRVPERIDR